MDDATEVITSRTRRTQLRMMEVLAYTITFAVIALTFLPMFFEVPDAGRDIVMSMKEALINAWVFVVGYVFGSSIGSHNKDQSPNKKPEEPEPSTAIPGEPLP